MPTATLPLPELRLHGPPHLRWPDGRARALAAREAALLAWLHLEGPAPRAVLAGRLWPGSDEAQARANLRQALVRLRRSAGAVLAEGPAGLCLAEGLRVAPDPAMVDPAAESGALRLLGPLEFDDTPDLAAWLSQRRDAAERDRLRLRLAAAREHLAAGRLDEALAAADALLAADPAVEEAHRVRMDVFRRRGDRAAAIGAWDACRDALRTAFGIAPSVVTNALGRQLLAEAGEAGDAAEAGEAGETGEVRAVGEVREAGSAGRAGEAGKAVRAGPAGRADAAQTGHAAASAAHSGTAPRKGVGAAAVQPAAHLLGPLQQPPPLVGRAAVLGPLVQALAHGQAVVLSGVGGLGKSRLLAEAIAAVAPAPGAALRVGARPGDVRLPGAVLSRLVGAALGACAPTLDAATRADVQRLLADAEGRERAEPAPLTSALAQRRLFGALPRLIAACRLRGLRLVAIDDLHVADELSLSALQVLAGDWVAAPPDAAAPLALAFALRPDEAPPAAAALLDPLAGSGRCVRFELAPLSPDAVRALVRALRPAGDPAGVGAGA
ncbi:BTAD domain-containing putative transcriptional regulator, partial [Piscinibacter sakaiensis]|uniref:BTAD domain-containing putative transcriptional regulator n=1 Tax=Piscinibacter sakaiensis TaxID=1547922 RepID=UPI0009EA5710